MSTIVYRISVLLSAVVADVPVGMNLGLFWLLWALISGRFLLSRGAVFPALADGGLPADAVRRSGAALAYGRWAIQPLVWAWHQLVQQEGRWHAHRYEGFRPVACDLVGFFRPRLSGCLGKHYQSGADKALPAIVLAVVVAVGSVGKVRLPLVRLLLRADPDVPSEAALQRRAIIQAGMTLQPDEVLVVDAGFGVAALLRGGVPRFVARVARNFTARRNVLPAYTGRGWWPVYGERVRPLPHTHKGKTLAATLPDTTAQCVVAGRTIHAQVWDNLVLSTAKPGAPAFRCVAIHDPRYQEPLVVATNLPVSAYALWCLYRDRWPVEQLPLAAKQMRRRRLVAVKHRVVFGTQAAVGQVLAVCGWQIQTAFVERLNLSLRQRIAAIGRRSATLCKHQEGLGHQLALFQVYHNFVLPHAGLRQALAAPLPTNGTGSAKVWQPRTPAMAAGLTDHVWSLKEVLLYRVPPWPQPQTV